MKAAAPGYTCQKICPYSFLVHLFGYQANSFRDHNDISRWLLDSKYGTQLNCRPTVPISACNDFGNQILVRRPLAYVNVLGVSITRDNISSPL